MKSFSVEIKATYEVEALTREDALRAVPSFENHRMTASVEYVVRERRQTAVPEERASDADVHGLIKPVYSVAEAALILGVSPAQVYAQAGSGAIPCIRLGKRQIRIPRSSLVAVLEGRPPSPTVIEESRRVRRTIPAQPSSSTRGKVPAPPTQPRERIVTRPSQRKEMLSIGEAAGMLHVSSARVRNLVDDRKIFFTQQGSKVLIPKRAVEAFAEGRKPIDVVEENIALYKNLGGWDDDMEQTARALRKEWK